MEQWFDPKTADVISGELGGGLAIAGAIIACSYRLCIRKGWKKLFYVVFAFIIAVYVGIFITGLVALLIKQPNLVLSCFLIPGSIGTIILVILFFIMCREFTKYELRQMQAKDL